VVRLAVACDDSTAVRSETTRRRSRVETETFSQRGCATEASSDIGAARLESERRFDGASPHGLVVPLDAQSNRAPVADTSTREAAARIVISLGPATVVAGLVWALLQPYRVTLFEPLGQGFWWLAVEPPMLVVLVGVLFHLVVARGLVRDLLDAGSRHGGDC
jgi:hypothetical protein